MRNGIAARPPDDVDDFLQRHVVVVRTWIVAPAQMHPDAFSGNVHERPMSASTFNSHARAKTGEVEVLNCEWRPIARSGQSTCSITRRRQWPRTRAASRRQSRRRSLRRSGSNALWKKYAVTPGDAAVRTRRRAVRLHGGFNRSASVRGASMSRTLIGPSHAGALRCARPGSAATRAFVCGSASMSWKTYVVVAFPPNPFNRSLM